MHTPEQKRRGPLSWLAGRSWRFWTSLALLLPVLYVASFGPWCRLHRAGPGQIKASALGIRTYYPIVWLLDHGPCPVKEVLKSYIGWWVS